MPSHWQRRRGSLGPVQVMISLMSMSVLGTESYETTLDGMKRRMGGALGWKGDEAAPSASALTQARRKFDAEKCSALVQNVYALCSTARSHASLGYGGFRLLALDGTKIPLPAYTVFQDHFGGPSQEKGVDLPCPQASLAALWDVGANQPVAYDVGTYKTSEQAQARSLITSLGVGDLLLADRNFPSRRFLTSLNRRGVEVLMRMRTCVGRGTLKEVTAFIASRETDAIVAIETRDDANRACSDLPTIQVRLLRHTLADGSTAVYMTSLLDQQRHPATVLIHLYAQRWRIETAFLELKLWHGLQHFHSREVLGIHQEIAAVMIFQLLASEVEAQLRLRIAASQTHAGKPIQPVTEPTPTPTLTLPLSGLEPQTRTRDGLGDGIGLLPPPSNDPAPLTIEITNIRFNRRIIADCALNLMRAAILGENIDAEFNKAMKRIWRYRQKVRPGRTFPRRRKSASLGWKKRGTKGKGRA